MKMAEVILNPKSLDDYRKFLAIKKLPAWRIKGRVAWFPDEYADRIGVLHEEYGEETDE
jgi:hypothetical protein